MSTPNRAILPDQTLATASRTRYWVVLFAVTLAVLSMVDRVAISQAAPNITRELGLSKQEMGAIFSAFAWGYALFEVPGGFLGDLMGPRRVIFRIVLWWSAFTALTGVVRTQSLMWWVRFLFGAGEAGAFPNLTKAFSIWLRSDEKVRAQGIMWTFARWGGAFTPPLVAAVLRFVDWRTAFMLFGAIGVVWAAVFFWWFRDDPREHPGVNAGERALLEESRQATGSHGDVPWGAMLRSRSVWLLWLQYFCLSYPWYFYITWLPTYLREYRGLESSWYAVVPLFFGGLGSLTCGFMLPRVAEAVGDVGRARRTMAIIGFVGAATLLYLSIQLRNPVLAVFVLGLASFCNDLVMPPSWSGCMDVGGKYAGTMSGSMNMMGNFAGGVAPWLGGLILDQTKDWNLFMYTMVGMYVVGALCWPLIDPVTPLEEKRHA